jgi:Helix-turn-helix domain
VDELMEIPCGCFGSWLRRFREERKMNPETFAAAARCTPERLEEVERGLRAVSSEWVRAVDERLDGNGVLTLSAGDSLHFRLWRKPDMYTGHIHDGPGPIRLPGAFIAMTGSDKRRVTDGDQA